MPSSTIFTIGGNTVKLYLGEDATGASSLVEEQPPWASGDPAKATLHLTCAWSARYTVFAGLMGSASGGPGAIVRVVPAQYPNSTNLYCMSIGDIRGIQYRGGLSYTGCHFKANFEVPKWGFDTVTTSDPSGKPWTTTRSRVSAEVTTVPLGCFVWTEGVDSGKPVPESSLGILTPHIEFSMQRHLMPYTPIDEAATYIGTVNSSAVTIGNRTFAAGYLLFTGMSATETDNGFSRSYEVEYTLLGTTDHSWNQLLDRKATYRTINGETDLSGRYPFPYSAFWTGLP